MLPISARDSATDPEAAELPIPEVRPPTLMSEPPVPPINDPHPLILLPEAEATLTALAIPPVYKPAERLASPPELTHDAPPTNVTVTALRDGDEPDVTLKNRLSPADDTLTLIKLRSRVRLLDFVTRLVWGRWSCHGVTVVSRRCGESGGGGGCCVWLLWRGWPCRGA